MKKVRLVLIIFLGLILFSAYASAQGRNDRIALYRLYNAQSRDHLYTTDCRERDEVSRNNSYAYEGIAGYIATRQTRRTMPLYRLLLSSGEHFYTTDQNEMNQLTRDSRNRLEGITGYLADSQDRNSTPFYRLITGDRHLYTADEREKNNLLRDSANRLEGTEGYIWTSGRDDCGSNGGGGGISNDYPIVYSNENFTGASQVIDRDWNVGGDWDGSPNTIRAILIPRGWRVVLYRRDNFRGESVEIDANSVFQRGNRWLNRIGSIRVYRDDRLR